MFWDYNVLIWGLRFWLSSNKTNKVSEFFYLITTVVIYKMKKIQIF